MISTRSASVRVRSLTHSLFQFAIVQIRCDLLVPTFIACFAFVHWFTPVTYLLRSGYYRTRLISTSPLPFSICACLCACLCLCLYL